MDLFPLKIIIKIVFMWTFSTISIVFCISGLCKHVILPVWENLNLSIGNV